VKKKFDGINIIPFVDIMLVLLAIVLTTSTLVEKKLIPVSLPSASSASDTIESKDITITIDKNGTLFWENEILSKEQLQEAIAKLQKKDTVTINCDKNAKFEHFVTLLDALKQKDLKNISIVTKNE